MSAPKASDRYSFKRLARLREEFGDVHGLVEVWADGEPVGLLNKTATGYALRTLDGNLIGDAPGIDRVTAAGVLTQSVQCEEGNR